MADDQMETVHDVIKLSNVVQNVEEDSDNSSDTDKTEEESSNDIGKEEPKESSEDASEAEKDDWAEIDKDGWENVLGSGRLRRRIITAGEVEGYLPSKGTTVKVDLKGSFEDEVFEDLKGLEFNCEEGEAFRALDLVVALMHPGETDEFIADPDLAYGQLGLSPHVPPNAAVHFQVTLLEVKRAQMPMKYEVEERKAIGMRKKERGNFWMLRNEHSMAVQCYRKAVEYFDDESIELEVAMDKYTLPEVMQEMVDERIKCYNNQAQAQLKLEAWDSALASVAQVLKLDPNNEKANFRKAKAYLGKGDTDKAIGPLRRVTRMYPQNASAQAELQRVLQKEAKANEKAKNLSKKMLGLDKYEAEKVKESARYTWWKQTAILGTSMAFIGASLGALMAYYNH